MATGKLADRWFEQFSIPGYSAYEANQRTLETFGTGRQYPLVAVFQVKDGDIRAQPGIEKAIAAGAAVNKGSRVELVVRDERRHVRLGRSHDDVREHLPDRRVRPSSRFCRSRRPAQRSPRSAPPGVTTHVTGSTRSSSRRARRGGPSVLAETLLGGIGALADPAVRVRHAAGRADAAPRRDLVDPDDVPLRARADVRDGRLDHRPVPRRARRARRSRSTTRC